MFYSDGHELGGSEIHLGSLLESLPERFELIVAAVNPRVLTHLRECRPSATAALLPMIRSRTDPRGILAQLRFLLRTRPQVLQISLNRPWGSQWVMLAGVLIPGVKVIAVDHSPRRPLALRHRLYLRLIPRFVAAHVVMGRGPAETVGQLVGSATGVVVIPPGVVDLPRVWTERSVCPAVIGTVGRLAREKGVDVLLTALAELPEVRLLVVGDGDERSALEALAAELGVADRVEFTGWSAEARRELERLDLFVLPSRLDSLPLSIVEAMLAELPVVATRVGGVAEMVDDDTGRLVESDDPEALAEAIRSLLADPELRSRLGRAGRERALSHFATDTMVKRFTALYDRLLGCPPSDWHADSSGALVAIAHHQPVAADAGTDGQPATAAPSAGAASSAPQRHFDDQAFVA